VRQLELAELLGVRARERPFSWPNSSDSRSVSGMAATLMATSGWPLRGLGRWMARATSALPVPLSPVMSTVVGVVAICVMSCSSTDPPEPTQEDLSERKDEQPE
jgi:hypothetical protein